MVARLLLLVVAFASTASFADEMQSVSLEDLLNVEVTTATKKAQKLEESPGTITVITRKQIQDTNARTLRDVLNVFVPGMDVVPAYFRYGDRVSEGVYSRGLLSDFSQQVLFLQNGIGKFNDATFSSAYPAIEFTLENVERIEVSRTPIPIYGGSAITTINIITREQFIKSGAEFFIDIGAMSDVNMTNRPLSSRRISGNFGTQLTPYWHASSSVQTYSDAGMAHNDKDGTGGFTGRMDTLRDGTKSAMNATLVLQSEDKKWFIQSNYKDINRDAFMSGQVPSQSVDVYNYRGVHFILDAKYKPTQNLEFVAGMARTQFENTVQLANTAPVSDVYGGQVKNFNYFAEANYNLNVGAHSILSGVRVEQEGQHEGSAYQWTGGNWVIRTDDKFLMAPNTNRTVLSAFSEDTWKISNNMTFVAGARFDHYNGYAGKTHSTINPRVATAIKMSDSTTLKFTYASASRPPSIYEKLGVNLPPLKGNKDLDPETVHTIEASVIYKDSNFKGQITPFYSIFQDKIEFVGVAPTLLATNNDDANVMGLELDAQYYVGKSYFFGNFAWVSSKDGANNDDQTRLIPQMYVNGGFNWQATDATTVNLTAFYRGDRELGSKMPKTADVVEPHLNANLSVNYDLSPKATVYALIENIADQKNYVPLDLPTPTDNIWVPLRERTYHVGLKWSM